MPGAARSLPTAPARALLLLAAAGAIVEFLVEWGRRGRAADEFILPSGLVVDEHDRVYVADLSNYRVQVIGPDGAFVDALKARQAR